jgi:hypothetical protein
MDMQKNLLPALSSLLIAFTAQSIQVRADEKPPSTVTFINLSGSPALVVLDGPTRIKAEVGDGSKASLNVPGGSYALFARYGDKEPYHYSKGKSFTVTQTATQYSRTTITLHKVVGGNYPMTGASKRDFEAAYAGAASIGAHEEPSAAIEGRELQPVQIYKPVEIKVPEYKVISPVIQYKPIEVPQLYTVKPVPLIVPSVTEYKPLPEIHEYKPLPEIHEYKPLPEILQYKPLEPLKFEPAR